MRMKRWHLRAKFPWIKGMDLAKEVTCERYRVGMSPYGLFETGYATGTDSQFHVVAYDFGVKSNILHVG